MDYVSITELIHGFSRIYIEVSTEPVKAQSAKSHATGRARRLEIKVSDETVSCHCQRVQPHLPPPANVALWKKLTDQLIVEPHWPLS